MFRLTSICDCTLWFPLLVRLYFFQSKEGYSAAGLKHTETVKYSTYEVFFNLLSNNILKTNKKTK